MRVKFNTAKKKAGLEIMTFNHEKMQHVSNLIELMSKGRGGGGGGGGGYNTVYRNVLENRQVGRTFKLVNSKYKD